MSTPYRIWRGENDMGMIRYIKEEFQVITERDPAIKSPMEVLLYPSFRAILSYRLAHRWYSRGHYFWARWLSQRTVRKTGIESTDWKRLIHRSWFRCHHRRDDYYWRQCNALSGRDAGRNREGAREAASYPSG